MYNFCSFPLFSKPSSNINEIKEKRKIQTCSMCRNHNINSIKKGHSCQYQEPLHTAICSKCKFTETKNQIRAKDKKYSGSLKKSSTQLTKLPGGKRATKMCKKCQYHGKVVPIAKHECKFSSCDCNDCKLVEERRRVDRIVSKQDVNLNIVSSPPSELNTMTESDNECSNEVFQMIEDLIEKDHQRSTEISAPENAINDDELANFFFIEPHNRTEEDLHIDEFQPEDNQSIIADNSNDLAQFESELQSSELTSVSNAWESFNLPVLGYPINPVEPTPDHNHISNQWGNQMNNFINSNYGNFIIDQNHSWV